LAIEANRRRTNRVAAGLARRRPLTEIGVSRLPPASSMNFPGNHPCNRNPEAQLRMARHA
jgi:hypothetical protein